MVITVAVRVEHLPSPSSSLDSCLCSIDQAKLVLATNLAHSGTVKSTLKAFVAANLFVPEAQQLLVAPAFTKLNDAQLVEDVYKRYRCQADADDCDLFVDEDHLTFFCRENGRSVQLPDDGLLDEYNILDKSVVQLKRAPQALPATGGRLFIETKDGILPLLGISASTRVSSLKEAIEKHSGVLKSQQILSSVGKVMHDEFYLKDFEGVHSIYEDSVLDLARSGDKNSEQAHRRMLITVKVLGEEDFEILVQGRDSVQSIMSLVEARTGVPSWQQRLSFSGKLLDEGKTLADYFIGPQSALQVSLFRHPTRLAGSTAVSGSQNAVMLEADIPAARKIKMVRTCKGVVVGAMTIPVLTSDTIGDMKRKVKLSLKPLSSSVGTPPRSQITFDPTPKSSPSSPGAYRLPPPPLDNAAPLTPYGTPRTRFPASPFHPASSSLPGTRLPTPQASSPAAGSHYETPKVLPPLSAASPTASCYRTPPATRPKSRLQLTESGSTPPSRAGKPSSTRRLLKFGSVEESPQKVLSSLDENASSYRRPTSSSSSLSSPSVQDKISKVLVQIEAAGSGSGPVSAAAGERKGLGAWLKQKVITLH